MGGGLCERVLHVLYPRIVYYACNRCKTCNAGKVPSDLPGRGESTISQEEEERYPYLH